MHNLWTSITEGHMQNATTYANNARTILIPPALLGQIAPHLPPFFFVGRSVLASTSTNVRVRQDLYPRSISRLLFERISVTPKLSLIQPGAELNVTLNFSRKRCRTKPLTLNTSNPFSKNLMIRELRKNSTSFGSSAKVSGRQ